MTTNVDPGWDEDTWSGWFVHCAKLFGWTRRYHTHDSRRSAPGFPDWVLVHERKSAILFVELKGAKTRITPEQTAWNEALRGLGLPAYIWRPADADEALDRLRHPREGKWA